MNIGKKSDRNAVFSDDLARKPKKRIFRVIGKILLVLLILFVIVTIISFFYQMAARKKDRELLEQDGYVNLVSAGDYQMNINIYGDGKHKIIAMPGSGDAGFSVDMKKFAEYLGDDVTVVAVSRPGYGLTEDTKSDITTEYIVDSTRTALKNAGIEAPYILMPHSMSGIYGTYWENAYPDEIEGVVFLDSTNESEDEFPEEGFVPIVLSAYLGASKFADQTGLSRSFGDLISVIHHETPEADEKDVAAFEGVSAPATGSKEIKNYNANMRTAWSSIQSNTIPKVYISTDYESIDDVKEYLTFQFGTIDEEMLENLSSEVETPSDWKKEKNRKQTEYIRKLGNCKQINIPGSHFIYEQKPEECAKVIADLIDDLAVS